MHPSGASGTTFEAFLGPRGSRFERLKRLCMFGKAACGLGRIAVLTGIERIADCNLGAMRCKDARQGLERVA
eukprot:9168413-Alexandrium_andersonii.AAC.1